MVYDFVHTIIKLIEHNIVYSISGFIWKMLGHKRAALDLNWNTYIKTISHLLSVEIYKCYINRQRALIRCADAMRIGFLFKLIGRVSVFLLGILGHGVSAVVILCRD